MYFLRHRNDTFEKFKEVERLIFNRFGCRITTIRYDNGTEFRKMSKYMSSEQRAEREIRTIVESARAMLIAKKLLIKFWAEAANTGIYTLNRYLLSQTKQTTL